MRIRFRAWLLIALAAFVAVNLAPVRAAETTPDAIKARGVLRVGVKYDAPPFGQLDPRTNQVTGFDIDIARAIAKTILGDENKVQLVQVTSANRIPQLQNGNIDLIIATMTITKDRLEQIDFSNVYYRAGQSLLVKTARRSRATATWPATASARSPGRRPNRRSAASRRPPTS